MKVNAPYRCFSLLLVGLCCFVAGCATTRGGQEKASHEEAILRLEKRLIEHPDDAEALRELGVIYLEMDRYGQAYEQLKKAYARAPDDPKTIFYLGMVSEMLGRQKTALRLYGHYADVSRGSLYRERMEGRYRWLLRVIARKEMQQRLRLEAQRVGGASPRIVAVFPLSYEGTDDRYAPLGYGLSEMIMVDLAQVGRLKVVERVRLQALLDELKLAQTEYVDPETAPRAGRLLGAGRLIGGSFNVEGEGQLRLAAILAQLGAEQQFPRLETRRGSLERLFRLEKELVLSVLEAMGVELTVAERRAIESVPTRNLQAFMAYSKGLEEEASGRYAAAAEAYSRAAELDPSFEEASAKAEAASSLSASAGAPGAVLDAVLASEKSGSARLDLLQHRMQMINQTTGFIFYPGDEARQPASEAAEASGSTGLPDPPPPPPQDR